MFYKPRDGNRFFLSAVSKQAAPRVAARLGQEEGTQSPLPTVTQFPHWQVLHAFTVHMSSQCLQTEACAALLMPASRRQAGCLPA